MLSMRVPILNDKNIKDGVDNSAKTATSYITQVDSQGIWVTPSALKPTNTETGAGATGARINADGMEIFQNGDAVAHYGDYARIGKEGEANTTISPGEVVISAGNNIDALRITPDGNTQKARFTIYVNRKILAGASLTYTHPSAADSNTNIVYTLTPEGSSSSKMITVTKGQTTATTTVTSPFSFEYSATTSAITIKNNESSTPIILLVASYTKTATVPLIKGGGVLALGASPRATDFGTVFAVGNGTASFNAFTVFDTGLVTIHGGVGSVGSITLDGSTGYVEINGEQVWPPPTPQAKTITESSLLTPNSGWVMSSGRTRVVEIGRIKVVTWVAKYTGTWANGTQLTMGTLTAAYAPLIDTMLASINATGVISANRTIYVKNVSGGSLQNVEIAYCTTIVN